MAQKSFQFKGDSWTWISHQTACLLVRGPTSYLEGSSLLAQGFMIDWISLCPSCLECLMNIPPGCAAHTGSCTFPDSFMVCQQPSFFFSFSSPVAFQPFWFLVVQSSEHLASYQHKILHLQVCLGSTAGHHPSCFWVTAQKQLVALCRLLNVLDFQWFQSLSSPRIIAVSLYISCINECVDSCPWVLFSMMITVRQSRGLMDQCASFLVHVFLRFFGPSHWVLGGLLVFLPFLWNHQPGGWNAPEWPQGSASIHGAILQHTKKQCCCTLRISQMWTWENVSSVVSEEKDRATPEIKELFCLRPETRGIPSVLQHGDK